MRFELRSAIRSALDVAPPPLALGSIRERAAKRSLHGCCERASAGVVAAMLVIAGLSCVMIDRTFSAPAPVVSSVPSPVPVPVPTES